MLRSLTPADVLPSADGAPFSARYGDVYASRDGALGQARHVFIGGNDLPARWADADQFVIAETGFGIGSNFLATWQVWRADPARPQRLHFVSVERHPVRVEHLRAFAPPELAPLAHQLAAAWPLPLPGLHRREFDDGAVLLTLAFGDARELLPRLVCGADALYLDGFAPDRNPEMWEPALLKAVARLARPGATLATWCTARAVRDALSEAGFELQLRTGFGRKRDMLTGRYAPRWRTRRHEPPAAYRGERSALVIGAGLAGANAAHALARRGWRVQALERGARIAGEASALPWGLLHPQITADDSVFARLTRAGCFASRAALARLEAQGGTLWSSCGVLQQAASDAEFDRWIALHARAGWPEAFAVPCDAEAAAALIGRRPRRGGWWYADGALVAAARWSAAALAHASIEVRCDVAVERLQREGDGWRALDAGGRALATAPVAIVACAFDAPRLLGTSAALTPVRGRITRIDPAALDGLRAGLAGEGYVLNGSDGWAGVGATYEVPLPGEASGALDAARAHASNLARLPRLLADPPQVAPIGMFDATRCVSRDRLPLAGQAADLQAVRARQLRLRGAHLADLPRAPGLYASFAFGSRGLSLAALAAELIAARIEGEPLPLERDLADALDPARELLRALRRARMVSASEGDRAGSPLENARAPAPAQAAVADRDRTTLR
jgi:tRNA 5-methylaminomethyl-2-thiouridine biosynthesis bifunctional protein